MIEYEAFCHPLHTRDRGARLHHYVKFMCQHVMWNVEWKPPSVMVWSVRPWTRNTLKVRSVSVPLVGGGERPSYFVCDDSTHSMAVSTALFSGMTVEDSCMCCSLMLCSFIRFSLFKVLALWVETDLVKGVHCVATDSPTEHIRRFFPTLWRFVGFLFIYPLLPVISVGQSDNLSSSIYQAPPSIA